MADDLDKWFLLVEDDKLFSTLFRRFFSQQAPQSELRVVGSVAEARALLQEMGQPQAAVLDHHLNDGFGEDLLPYLKCRVTIWSAGADDPAKRKPHGREALEDSVREILGGS